MATALVEHVLVVPTKLFQALGYFQGFHADVTRYLDPLLESQEAAYRPRPLMEQDPSFKQLIPYVIFRHEDERQGVRLFQYTRGSGQGEQRLHRKLSIGVGGHISSEDACQVGRHPYHEGMRRELDEEVVIETPMREQCVGLINDDQTEVGRVHLGVVHIIDVDQPLVRPREHDLQEAGFRTLEELRAERERMESWSRICFDALFA